MIILVKAFLFFKAPIFNHKTGSDDTVCTIRKTPENHPGASIHYFLFSSRQTISVCVGCAPGTCKMLFHFHTPFSHALSPSNPKATLIIA